MAFKVQEFAEAINQSNIFLEKSKLVIINSKGNREEYITDSEVIGKGPVGFSGDRIIWRENRKEVVKAVSTIKSVNGIPAAKYGAK